STAPRPHTYPSVTSPENGCTDHSDGSAGTTSRWPCTSSAPRSAVPAGSPANRAKTLVRPGALSRSTGSRPTSASCAATNSAATRSPAEVRVSPVFVVSIRIRSRHRSTTSSLLIARSYHCGGPFGTGGDALWITAPSWVLSELSYPQADIDPC